MDIEQSNWSGTHSTAGQARDMIYYDAVRSNWCGKFLELSVRSGKAHQNFK